MPKSNTIRQRFPVKPPERRYGLKYRQWLEDQNRLLLLALKHSADAVMLMTPDGEMSYVNPVAEKLLDKTEAELVGTNLLSLFRSSDGEQVGQEFKQRVSIESELHCSLSFLRSADGDLIPIELHMSELRIKDVLVRIQATCRDLRRDLEFQRQLETQALTDQLTGCLNRRWFDREFQRASEWARTTEDWLSLIFVDLDHFKQYNDQDYSLGDALIQASAKAMQDVMRPNDKLTRIGGDEFVLLLTGVSREVVAQIAERLRTSLNDLFVRFEDGSRQHFSLTSSVGISSINGTDPRLPEIKRFAQEAKRLAKEDGRNCIRFLPEDAYDRPSVH